MMLKRTHCIGILIALFLGGAGLSSHAWASLVELPLNNSTTTSDRNGKVDFGIDYSDIFDRQLESSGSGGSSASGGRITQANQVHTKVIYAVNQYLNIYGKLGASQWKEKVSQNNGAQIAVNYKTGFSWGLGTAGGIRFAQDWQVFYDLQYLATPSIDVSTITLPDRTTSIHTGSINAQEFHLALGAGREFHTYSQWASVIFPYLGVVLSTLTIDHNSITWSSGSFNDRLHEDSKFGLFAGIRFANESNWTLRFEGRVGDESSVSLSLDYLF